MYKDIMIKVGEGYKDIPLDKVQESLDSEDNSSSYKFFIVAALIEHIENLTLSIREFHNSLVKANSINKEQADNSKEALSLITGLYNQLSDKDKLIKEQAEEINKLKEELEVTEMALTTAKSFMSRL